MPRFCRDAVGLHIAFEDATRPFSNFRFVEEEFGELPALRRVMSQVRLLECQTLTVEEFEIPDDLREENQDITTRLSTDFDSHSYRLGFFSNRFDSIEQLEAAPKDSFLGYAVVKIDEVPGRRVARVYESVVQPSRHENNYIRGAPTWRCEIHGVPFQIDGYIFAEQNRITNVCAHAALRSAVSAYHPNGDMTYREMNTALGIDHKTRTVGKDGNTKLQLEEMMQIMELAGARCFPFDYTVPHDPEDTIPFQKYLYGSVESGCPALLLFKTLQEGVGHTVPVFGHTFNEDTWVPRAETLYFTIGRETKHISSESWLSMFIAHDDNLGSNFCIPNHYFSSQRHCRRIGIAASPCPQQEESVLYVIGTLPSTIRINSIRAEAIASEYLGQILDGADPGEYPPWGIRLAQHAKRFELVLRPVLTDCKDYARHLGSVTDWEGDVLDRSILASIAGRHVGERLWMVEISIPELFSTNRRKLGEVLVCAEAEPGRARDTMSFVLARIPGWFVFCEKSDSVKPTYVFKESGAEGHVELVGCEDSRSDG